MSGTAEVCVHGVLRLTEASNRAESLSRVDGLATEEPVVTAMAASASAAPARMRLRIAAGVQQRSLNAR
ncbi:MULTISPECIES: hypothetical protein [Amycolatopsis]|uniref:Uncharacterized protein n=1 Tax=Amycolatopsis dongchuanensis TaxID=1070866 RepID=A0ABP9R4X8_9PSEU|nr:hypothetical protein [Amycolatopsis sacchari]